MQNSRGPFEMTVTNKRSTEISLFKLLNEQWPTEKMVNSKWQAKKAVGYPVVSNSNIRIRHFSSKRERPGKGAVAGSWFKSELFQSFGDNREAPVSSAKISYVAFAAALCNLYSFLLPSCTLSTPPSSHSSGCYEQHLKEISFPTPRWQNKNYLTGNASSPRNTHGHQTHHHRYFHFRSLFFHSLCPQLTLRLRHSQRYKKQCHRSRDCIHE